MITTNKIIILLGILSIPLSSLLFSSDVSTTALKVNPNPSEQVAMFNIQASLKGCVGLGSTCDRRT